MRKVTSSGAGPGRGTDLELVTDIEEQTVLLLRSQVVHRSLYTWISTVTSDGQVGAVIPGGSESIQMSVNVVDVENGDIEGFAVPVSVSGNIVVAATLRLEGVDFDAVVANDRGGIGGG